MSCNVPNRTIFCKDNIEILQGINSESIDLVYLDPPFNKKKVFTAPVGSSAEGASFSDIFRREDLKDEWLLTIAEDHENLYTFLDSVKTIEGRTSYNYCYLVYMAIRLMEVHRVLKPSGSVYLHCDPTMSHYLKIVMDCVFGEKHFRNEIVWKRTYAHNDPKRFGRNTDTIFFYTKRKDFYFKPVYMSYDQEYIDTFFVYEDKRGKYRTVILTGPGVSGGDSDAEWRGYKPSQSGRHWSVPKRIVHSLIGEEKAKNMTIIERLELLEDNGYILFSKNGIPQFKQYLHEMQGMPAQKLWHDIKPIGRSKEYLGYPTQKPLALLKRIITASCPENGIVLDPFCGCATACVAAETLARKWIGVDVSIKAYELVKKRLKQAVKGTTDKEEATAQVLFTLDPDNDIHCKTDPPTRTDKDQDYRVEKYVYVISHKKYENFYKVGITNDIDRRLSSYQTGDPDRGYTFEFSIQTPHFRAVEKHIHEHFDNKLEWVNASLGDIMQEIHAEIARLSGGL